MEEGRSLREIVADMRYTRAESTLEQIWEFAKYGSTASGADARAAHAQILDVLAKWGEYER